MARKQRYIPKNDDPITSSVDALRHLTGDDEWEVELKDLVPKRLKSPDPDAEKTKKGGKN